MHVNKLLTLALASALSACAIPAPVVMSTHFNAADVAWAKTKGTNALSGQGFLRQQGGDVVTCAGEEVDLVPVAPYASERIGGLYGNTTKGYVDPFLAPRIPPAESGYTDSWLKSQCDAQGKFSFSSVADGDYFLVTQVIWYAGNSQQGGYLMQRVSLHGGGQKDVLLTHGG